jgi:hypothetical protein
VKCQIVASPTDDSGGISYDRNMFIVQATGLSHSLRDFGYAVGVG